MRFRRVLGAAAWGAAVLLAVAMYARALINPSYPPAALKGAAEGWAAAGLDRRGAVTVSWPADEGSRRRQVMAMLSRWVETR